MTTPKVSYCTRSHLFSTSKWALFVVLLFSGVYRCSSQKADNDVTTTTNGDFILLGPGISSPELILPSRYFFLLHRVPFDSIVIRHVIDQERPQSQTRCRLWSQGLTDTHFCVDLPNSATEHVNYSNYSISQLLDEAQFCDDEQPMEESTNRYQLTVVRFKLYQQSQCDTPLELLITLPNGQVVLKRQIFDPHLPDTRFYSDQCDCPSADWAEKFHCSSSPANERLSKQIAMDLEPFAKGIDFDSILRQSVDRFAAHTRTYAFCLYQIVSNKLYRKCYGEYVGFARFYDEILMSLLRKVYMPDVEFVANLGDWPLSDKSKPALPMFSWCGSTDSYDIVLPTYELTESVLHALGRVSVDVLSTFGQQKLSFSEKEPKLFWRGRDSNRARLNLIKLARSDPDKYNVSITNFFFFRDEMHEYTDGRPQSNESSTESHSSVPYVHFVDFFKYRYQINIDGTVAAYRFPFLLAGNSLVLKQESKYYEFFYRLLERDAHYLPISADLSDLPKTIRELTSAPTSFDQAKRIIWRARQFALTHLLPEHIYCYYYNALTAYAALLQDRVKLRPEVEAVTLEDPNQPIYLDQDSPCTCEQGHSESNTPHSTTSSPRDEL